MLELAGRASAADEPSALGFYCALARQCFINEYVFDALDAEWETARRLRDLLVAALESSSPVPVLWPVAVASYFPLHSVPGADALLERNWPDSVTGLLVQQLREPAEERRIRASIPALTAIEHDVSLTSRDGFAVFDRLRHQCLLEIKSYVGKLPQPASFEDAGDILRGLFASQFPKLGRDDWIAFARRTFKSANGRIVPDYDVKLMETLAETDLKRPLPDLWEQFDALARVPVMVIRGGNSDILSAVTRRSDADAPLESRRGGGT